MPNVRIQSEGQSGSGVSGKWLVFQLSVWALAAIWVNPAFLSWLGFHGAEGWMVHHPLIRWATFVPLALLVVISAFRPVNSGPQQQALESLAASLGGSVVDARELAGFETPSRAYGPGLRTKAGPWTVDLVSLYHVKHGHNKICARALVETRSPFQFSAAGTGTSRAKHAGFAAWGMRVALRVSRSSILGSAGGAAGAGGARAREMAAMESLAYLAGPPVSSGNSSLDSIMKVWATDPAAAHFLFSDPSVAAAVAALHETTDRWEWILSTSVPGARGSLSLSFPAARMEPETLRRAHTTMVAGLTALARAGHLAAPRESRRAAA